MQASLDKRLVVFAEGDQQHRQRAADMDKTSKKAAMDRQELQRELDELNGRSKGDAQKAREVRVLEYILFFVACQGFDWSKRLFYLLTVGGEGHEFSGPCRSIMKQRG